MQEVINKQGFRRYKIFVFLLPVTVTSYWLKNVTSYLLLLLLLQLLLKKSNEIP